jgi:hypothetical protein
VDAIVENPFFVPHNSDLGSEEIQRSLAAGRSAKSVYLLAFTLNNLPFRVGEHYSVYSCWILLAVLFHTIVTEL